jgi:hypothetical protein
MWSRPGRGARDGQTVRDLLDYLSFRQSPHILTAGYVPPTIRKLNGLTVYPWPTITLGLRLLSSALSLTRRPLSISAAVDRL